MIIRLALLIAIPSALPMAATAQMPPKRATPPLVRVALKTTMGVITLDLDRARAPVTTANFLRYVDQKRFDGTVFYRTMKLEFGGPEPQGLIQGGTQYDPKRVLKPIMHEPTTQTGIRHLAGTISMARYAPGTATGDFSILLSAMPALDANPGQSGDNQGYAAFGTVVDGMDVVRKIYASPVSATRGEGFMKGQMIEAPVKIVTARRVQLVPLVPMVPSAMPPGLPPREALPVPAS